MLDTLFYVTDPWVWTWHYAGRMSVKFSLNLASVLDTLKMPNPL